MSWKERRRSNNCWLHLWMNSATQKWAECKTVGWMCTCLFHLAEKLRILCIVPSSNGMVWFNPIMLPSLRLHFVPYHSCNHTSCCSAELNCSFHTIKSYSAWQPLLPPVTFLLCCSVPMKWMLWDCSSSHCFAVSVLSLKNVDEVNQAIKFESS